MQGQLGHAIHFQKKYALPSGRICELGNVKTF